MKIILLAVAVTLGAAACGTDNVTARSSATPPKNTASHAEMVSDVLDLTMRAADVELIDLCLGLSEYGELKAYQLFSEAAGDANDNDLGITKQEIFAEIVRRCGR